MENGQCKMQNIKRKMITQSFKFQFIELFQIIVCTKGSLV